MQDEKKAPDYEGNAEGQLLDTAIHLSDLETGEVGSPARVQVFIGFDAVLSPVCNVSLHYYGVKSLTGELIHRVLDQSLIPGVRVQEVSAIIHDS